MCSDKEGIYIYIWLQRKTPNRIFVPWKSNMQGYARTSLNHGCIDSSIHWLIDFIDSIAYAIDRFSLRRSRKPVPSTSDYSRTRLLLVLLMFAATPTTPQRSQQSEAPTAKPGFGKISQDFVGFGRIWQDSPGFCKIWQDLVRRIFQDFAGLGKIWQDLNIFDRIW